MSINGSCKEQICVEDFVSPSTIPNTGPSQVLPFLYLGSQEDALLMKTMQEYQITHVINVSITGDKVAFIDDDDHEHFLRIPIHDSHCAKLLPYFDEAFEFIEKARMSHGRVFIHCLAGISRSPALAIAYIMRYLNLSFDDAYRHVKERRPHISPNFNFLGQLAEYEKTLCIQSKTLSPIIPLRKCIRIETPFNERCCFIPVKTSCASENTFETPTKAPSRPRVLECHRMTTSAAKRVGALTCALTTFAMDAPRQASKLLRPNTISFNCLSNRSDHTKSESNNVHSAVPLSALRVRSSSKTTEVSTLNGPSEMLTTVHQELSSDTSKLSQAIKSSQTSDSTCDASRTVTSAPCRVLVS